MSKLDQFHTEVMAIPDPAPFRQPRFIHWPSVCDTNRWPAPSAHIGGDASPSLLTHHANALCTIDPNGAAAAYLSNSEVFVQSPPFDPCPPGGQPLYCDAGVSLLTAPPHLFSTVMCGAGLPPPKNTPKPSRPEKPTKKRGRPPVFDEIKRTEFCAMIQSGSTHRHAAKCVGLDPATIRHACRKDRAFADRLQRAQQQRDLLAVRRIQNAGEKSWRAAAWLLERSAPDEFSFRNKKQDVWSYHGKRRLKRFVTDIVNGVLIDCMENADRSPIASPIADEASNAIDRRLAEIQSEIDDLQQDEPEFDETDDEPQGIDSELDESELDESELDESELDESELDESEDDESEDDESEDDESEDDESEDESEDDESDDDESEDDEYEDDEAGALAAYQYLMRKAGRPVPKSFPPYRYEEKNKSVLSSRSQKKQTQRR